ncbi:MULTISPECIES: amino acid permease [unclassified Paenibacillus]|uniref:amino acid permease n=1 Tax=unclassified Paenibacillus TaxID=185978 RepID=UPI002406D27F|nr:MULTISPECIES: amino acid permease [unclassified Paenibacillus]MDF9841156.1 amino acid efflux transporter [Paenibacillus sp. PastF-2]MDF9847672.1 amino acid efflux transporter [Paenibacillus sp. PastM-2]MDF9854241.1 amino acid efflux transporter [Paenibacillus sp. PastF-1]MDH6479588.1 amino acid efflux transporter [Paenibacillus sp. PastH-2]MDH6505253.1 amino acid efflux transporter [Paenibacillus sp. PastM-3]
MKQNHSLQRNIGMPQAIALYIGAVLGSGVLIVPGLAAEIAGPASLLAWGFMTLLILPLALSMGLLSAKYPNAGGVSHFVTLAFGPRAGAMVGWFFLMSVPIGGPVAALTGAGYMTAAMGWGDGARIALASAMLAVGLITNWIGMQVAGKVQIAVVIAIVSVLVFSFAAALPRMESAHFTPFIPRGWTSIGQAAAILFWCFIGWEAVSHLSEEFKDPQRAAIKGVTVAAVIVGVLYFLSALATVGTQSYLRGGADSSLVWIISQPLGAWGGFIAGLTGMFICTATIIAYTSAASRVAFALARQGYAPRWMSRLTARYHTPSGATIFLMGCYAVVLFLYGSGLLSITTLIQFPNATFILTYIGGCAAGIRLLKGSRLGVVISWISFSATVAVFPFTGWAIGYPIVIVACFTAVVWLRNSRRSLPDLPEKETQQNKSNVI